MTQSSVLVLGIGNVLLGDEGVGVEAVRALEDIELPPGVDLLDGGTGGFHLLGCFQEYPTVLILDATLDDQEPGTVSVTQPRYAADFPRVLSAHDIGLRDLLESAAILGPLPQMFLITISIAAKQHIHIGLSPPVRAAVSSVTQHAQTILQDLGQKRGHSTLLEK